MSAFTHAAIALTQTWLALALLVAPATAQQHAPEPAACPAQPARLQGTYTDTRKNGSMLSYVNTVTLTWVAEEDDLPPLPGVGTQPDGMVGSRAWREFHASDRPGCRVKSYRIESGQVQFKLDTRGEGIGGPGVCEASVQQTFGADVLKKYSALYIGERGYLITIGAMDFMIPDTTISGTCRTPGAVTPYTSPVNDNVIMLLDKRGPMNGDIVTGAFSESGMSGWTHSGSWTFVGR